MIEVDAVRLKIAELSEQLESNLPNYKLTLAEIHKTLRADPEMVHILDPEKDLSVIFEGMRRYKNIEIPITEQKAKKSSVPKGPVGLDDF